ncbi:ORFIII-like polyprotein [Tanacetum coccineum]
MLSTPTCIHHGATVYPPAQQYPQPFYRPELSVWLSSRKNVNIQWRAYSALEAIEMTQNITSQCYQELDLDDNWDIVSADFDDSSVYSILEGEVRSESESLEELRIEKGKDIEEQKDEEMGLKAQLQKKKRRRRSQVKTSRDTLEKKPSSIGKRMVELCKLDYNQSLLLQLEDKHLKHVTPEGRLEEKLKEKREWRLFYVWLVMPFGLKNAPAVFQRKMDKCFKGTESFIAVYIDDILVFSKNEKDHAKHLEKMLKICEDNGFSGLISNKNEDSKEDCDFNEEELKTKKGLRSFLGIFNYARNHIPSLGKNQRTKFQNFRDLENSTENAYIILETDGCMGDGEGVIKWKKEQEDPRSSYTDLSRTLLVFTTKLIAINPQGLVVQRLQMQSPGTGILDSCIEALYSVEEVLQSPNAFQKNMKTTCEEVMKISNHFLESSQKLFFTIVRNRSSIQILPALRPTKPHIDKDKSDDREISGRSGPLNLQQQKKAVKAMRNSYKQHLQYKAQICFGKSTKDNHWSDQREDVRVQNKEARRILIELEALAQGLGRRIKI